MLVAKNGLYNGGAVQHIYFWLKTLFYQMFEQFISSFQDSTGKVTEVNEIHSPLTQVSVITLSSQTQCNVTAPGVSSRGPRYTLVSGSDIEGIIEPSRKIHLTQYQPVWTTAQCDLVHRARQTRESWLTGGSHELFTQETRVYVLCETKGQIFFFPQT